MNYYNIYGFRFGEPVKLIFAAIPKSNFKIAFNTAAELQYEITQIIKIGNHSNFFIDEDVTDEIKSEFKF